MESSPQQPPLHPSALRRKLLWVFALPVVLVVVVIAGYLARSGSDAGGGGGEQDEIRKTVVDFSIAVDRNDNATVLSMLCLQEAEGVVYDIDSPDDHGDPQAELIPITVKDVRVTGDIAEVQVSRPQQQPATLFLRKENGSWKLCDPERYRR
ncbi:Rv0361 family membrane protein [Streptosporangium sandarakinum]